MINWQRYVRADSSVKHLEEQLDMLIDRKDLLYERTQPGSVDMEKIRGGAPSNAFDSYLIKMEHEQIDERIELSAPALERKKKYRKKLERQLRKSNDLENRIFVRHFLNGEKADDIADSLNYSTRQINRYLGRMKKYYADFEK